jgi:hypothetical protein
VNFVRSRLGLVAPLTGLALLFSVTGSPLPTRAQVAASFSTPSVVDPIHMAGEPDVGIDPLGRVYSSAPTGTGTQRSVWFGSVDGGHTYRTISPGPPPSGLQSINAPPGGGDTDINFDHTGKQYFVDLYALACLRTATTPDGGQHVSQDKFGSCTPPVGTVGADRQWLAVWDRGSTGTTPCGMGKPLVYLEFNSVATATSTGAAQWERSCDGLVYNNAIKGNPPFLTAQNYLPYGADGYPSIDTSSGKVLQAEMDSPMSGKSNMLLNIGTPDSSGDLTFLDAPDTTHPNGDQSKLIKVATNIENSSGDAANFTVSSIDTAGNLYIAWVQKSNTNPALRQAFVAAAPPPWSTWTAPQQVSDPGVSTTRISIFPWIKAGGPGLADIVWYGADKAKNPSTGTDLTWDVYMSQVAFPTDGDGHVKTSPAPTLPINSLKVTPHPMHYGTVCLAGTACIASQGNRNLADFFVVTIDADGAANIVYDDTSNGLVQPGFTPGNVELVDHSGGPLITVARQASGPGVFGHDVSGPANTPVAGLGDPTGDAIYASGSGLGFNGTFPPGPNVPGMDLLGSSLTLSDAGLTVAMPVVDLRNPSGTAQTIGSLFTQYVTRWQMGNTLYYAMASVTPDGTQSFSAGRVQSVDLCSVSACFPHVLTYAEGNFGGTPENGKVDCPPNPSPADPCLIRITIKPSDIGNPDASSLLEEVGAYALGASHPQALTTNLQAQFDNVPFEVDGVCCYNFRAATANGTTPPVLPPAAAGAAALNVPFSAAPRHPLPVVPIGVALVGALIAGGAGIGLRRRRRARP